MFEAFFVATLAIALVWLTTPILAWHTQVRICVTFRGGGRWCCGRRFDDQSER